MVKRLLIVVGVMDLVKIVKVRSVYIVMGLVKKNVKNVRMGLLCVVVVMVMVSQNVEIVRALEGMSVMIVKEQVILLVKNVAVMVMRLVILAQD
jgi:hypothetical protein